ncbi:MULTISPECIES: peptidoglycan-binding domain-containing protein [unclassified Clostridioides]|uniref:peptidoglycan-binding domain-containing protein n=2 Tax=Clostridioides TaxID=1870884 RepID=UPI001D0C3BF7|nr:peptidoglycan-binding protein [Clostridioides sp. ES-S-0049-03]MCC0678594.1 peptidoglycan-binding protein [Clostridioides sp. ES-W-0018-02]MCC0713455.1 peptidoglycan-binding protein [Clostridioides sp. ES-W-0017-02]MCC0765224.1 peptidoglycan-binding protein [Clostridioides sp. ES-S-0006-03]
MLKKVKKILIVLCCLFALTSGIVFADTETNSTYTETDKPLWTIHIEGYTFTYDNAPKQIKEEYKAKCEEMGITPSPKAEIFIPVDEMQSYGLKNYKGSQDGFDIFFYGTYFKVTGAKNYTVKTSTLVGYNKIESGNPVHLVQILLKACGYSIGVDSQFGNETYTRVRSFQSSNGLGVDGIVGARTWERLAYVAHL